MCGHFTCYHAHLMPQDNTMNFNENDSANTATDDVTLQKNGSWPWDPMDRRNPAFDSSRWPLLHWWISTHAHTHTQTRSSLLATRPSLKPHKVFDSRSSKVVSLSLCPSCPWQTLLAACSHHCPSSFWAALKSLTHHLNRCICSVPSRWPWQSSLPTR